MASAGQADGNSPAARNTGGQSDGQLRDIVRAIQKRRLLVFLVVAIVALVGGIIGVMLPHRYSATALVLIHTVPPGYFWAESSSDSAPPPQTSVETQSRLVSTYDNAQATSATLASGEGEYSALSVDPEEIIESASVEIEEPNVLAVTITSERDDAANAAVAIVNTLCQVYVQAAADRSRGVFDEAGQFLEQQIEIVEKQLSDLNGEYLDVLESSGMADPDLEVEGVQSLLGELRTKRTQVEQDLQRTRGSLRPLRSAVGEEQPTVELPYNDPNPQRDTLLENLAVEESELARVRARYTDSHPSVQEAMERVEAARRLLDEAPAEISRTQVERNPRYDEAILSLRQAEAQVSGLELELQAVDAALAEVDDRSQQLPSQRVQADDLREAVEIAREAHRELLNTLQTHRLRQASRSGIAELVDRAAEARADTSPLLMTLLFSILLGLLCGVVLAWLLEALDNTIRTPDEVTRQTGLPLLGAIPLLEDATPQVITLSAPHSPVSEAYRTLRSNISFALTDLPARSFLVSSALGGEGKSAVAANLAVITAHAGQTVYLVDTDLRKPVLANLFGCEPGRGLTNILVGDASLDDVIQDTGVNGLHLIATGPLPPNPAELLDSGRMTTIIDELHKRADVVIFDSPPALLLADAIILSSKTDRVIMTAESGRVTIDAFREVMRLMDHARGSLLGVVLNKHRVPTAGYYQYYYDGEPGDPGQAAPDALESTTTDDEIDDGGTF